jgi:hypothetical protein
MLEHLVDGGDLTEAEAAALLTVLTAPELPPPKSAASPAR